MLHPPVDHSVEVYAARYYIPWTINETLFGSWSINAMVVETCTCSDGRILQVKNALIHIYQPFFG